MRTHFCAAPAPRTTTGRQRGRNAETGTRRTSHRLCRRAETGTVLHHLCAQKRVRAGRRKQGERNSLTLNDFSPLCPLLSVLQANNAPLSTSSCRQLPLTRQLLRRIGYAASRARPSSQPGQSLCAAALNWVRRPPTASLSSALKWVRFPHHRLAPLQYAETGTPR